MAKRLSESIAKATTTHGFKASSIVVLRVAKKVPPPHGWEAVLAVLGIGRQSEIMGCTHTEKIE